MTREEARKELYLAQADVWYRPSDAAIDMSIKSLERELVVDKIRADIIAEFSHNIYAVEHGYLDQMLEIIDKYKAD